MIACLAGCTVTSYTSSNDTDTVSQSKISKDKSFLADIVEINFDNYKGNAKIFLSGANKTFLQKIERDTKKKYNVINKKFFYI